MLQKHSNLFTSFNTFSILSGQSVLSSDINSRHPILLGLRNVRKAAYMSGRAMYIFASAGSPYEIAENILSVCLKRAELVFKCVPDLMIE